MDEQWWEDPTTMGERPEMGPVTFLAQLRACMMLPLTEEQINTPIRSMGHPWQIPSPGILYIPEEIS